MRHAAASAIGVLGDQRATDSLVDALKDQSAYVRGGALSAIRKARFGQTGATFNPVLCKDSSQRVLRDGPCPLAEYVLGTGVRAYTKPRLGNCRRAAIAVIMATFHDAKNLRFKNNRLEYSNG